MVGWASLRPYPPLQAVPAVSLGRITMFLMQGWPLAARQARQRAPGNAAAEPYSVTLFCRTCDASLGAGNTSPPHKLALATRPAVELHGARALTAQRDPWTISLNLGDIALLYKSHACGEGVTARFSRAPTCTTRAHTQPAPEAWPQRTVWCASGRCESTVVAVSSMADVHTKALSTAP